METGLRATIAAACEATGVAATLFLVPLAATGGLDGLDLFAAALVVLTLGAALAFRGIDPDRPDDKEDSLQPPPL
jgi:hypothetical protein